MFGSVPQGKDGLALKAARGEAVGADLARQCPLLTPQQLYRLTEHYDNDWAIGAVLKPTHGAGVNSRRRQVLRFFGIMTYSVCLHVHPSFTTH